MELRGAGSAKHRTPDGEDATRPEAASEKMPLMKTLTKRKASPLVRAALALDEEALNWSVTVRPDEAAELAAALREYNEATPVRLAAIVASVDDLIPRRDCGDGNPSTGGMHHEYRIGREYSRVLYVQVVKTYLPDGFDLAALATRITKIAKGHRADEAWVTKDTPHDFEFRIWFD